MFRLVKLFNHFHNVSSVMVFLSSTLNPFIYGLWGKHFRAGIKSALCFTGNGSRTAMHVTNGHNNVVCCAANQDQPSPNNDTEDTTM